MANQMKSGRSEGNIFSEPSFSQSIQTGRRSNNNPLANSNGSSLLRPRGDSRHASQNSQPSISYVESSKKVQNKEKGQVVKSDLSLQGDKSAHNNKRSISLQKLRKDSFKANEEESKVHNPKNLSMTNQKGVLQNRFNFKEGQESFKNNNPAVSVGSYLNTNQLNGLSNQQNTQVEEKQVPQTGVMQVLNSMISVGQFDFKYKIDPSKKSSRSFGVTKAYAANTNMGIFRNYNEDRVSIILSISKPFNKSVEYWPKTSFFAVYDGHGGSTCSDFLRDNLHLFIVRDENFPQNPAEAIRRGIQYAEQTFLTSAEATEDRSGSCAIILLILDDVAYTANVGDSRSIISSHGCKSLKNLSFDHKPEDERPRIEAAGGRIYQSVISSQPIYFQGIKIIPPYRVFPGKLSVSRTIGDFEAKSVKHGGNPKVVISEPDIVATTITSEHDFIILACDGVYDRLTTDDVGQLFWKNIEETIDKIENLEDHDMHKQCGYGIEAVMKETFEKKSLDNVTLVVIAFEGFQIHYESLLEKRKKQLLQRQNPLATPQIPQINLQSSRMKQGSYSPNRPKESRGSDGESSHSARNTLLSGGKPKMQRLGSQNSLETASQHYQLQQQHPQQLNYNSVPTSFNPQQSNTPLKHPISPIKGVQNNMQNLPQVTQSVNFSQSQQQYQQLQQLQQQQQQQQYQQQFQQLQQTSSNTSLPQLPSHHANGLGGEFDQKLHTKLSQIQGTTNLRQLLSSNLNQNVLTNRASNNNNNKEIEPAYLQSKPKRTPSASNRKQQTASLHVPPSSNIGQRSARPIIHLENSKVQNSQSSSLLMPLKPLSSEKLVKRYSQPQSKNY